MAIKIRHYQQRDILIKLDHTSKTNNLKNSDTLKTQSTINKCLYNNIIT